MTSRSGRRIELTLAAAVVVAAGVLGGFLLGRSSTPSEERTSSPTLAPTPSPSATPELTHSPAPPNTDGAFRELAVGDRLILQVEMIPAPSLTAVGPCTVHRFGGNIAYITNCREYELRGEQLILFAVKLTNTSGEPLNFDLEHFLLSARDGAVFDPVDVRAEFKYDPALLPRSGLIPPGKARAGYVTFDGRLQFRVADSLAYADGDQVLTVHFSGQHTVDVV